MAGIVHSREEHVLLEQVVCLVRNNEILVFLVGRSLLLALIDRRSVALYGIALVVALHL